MEAIQNKKRSQAVVFIILSAFFFALMSFFVRLSGNLPTFQKAFFRNLIALMIAMPIFLKERHEVHFNRRSALVMAVRLVCGATGMLCNFYAIDHMNLSDANMLNKLSPFFAILASAVILREKPDTTDWLVLGIVFSGALLIMKPSMNVRFTYALIAVAGAAGSGIAYTCVRKLGMLGIPGPFIVFAFSTFTCLICLPWSLLFGVRPTLWQLGCLLLAGASAAGAQFSITAAYQRAEAKRISVFEYTQIPFAALLGFLFLDQVPDIFSIIGYVIIIGGSVLKHRLNEGKLSSLQFPK